MRHAQWMAPEVLQAELYDVAADVYALGIVLWEVATRRCPTTTPRLRAWPGHASSATGCAVHSEGSDSLMGLAARAVGCCGSLVGRPRAAEMTRARRRSKLGVLSTCRCVPGFRRLHDARWELEPVTRCRLPGAPGPDAPPAPRAGRPWLALKAEAARKNCLGVSVAFDSLLARHCVSLCEKRTRVLHCATSPAFLCKLSAPPLISHLWRTSPNMADPPNARRRLRPARTGNRCRHQTPARTRSKHSRRTSTRSGPCPALGPRQSARG